MSLPFEPESWESLRDRFGKACERLWVAEDLYAGKMESRPGLLREHVFDTEDGRRIIVSRDSFNGEQSLHFSMSIETSYIPAWKGKLNSTLDIVECAIDAIKKITGGQNLVGSSAVVKFTEKAVHLIFPLNLNKKE